MGMPARERRLVATFSTTHQAISAEAACKAAGVEGRIIPVPVAIHAECGLAWSMPPGQRERFVAASQEAGFSFDDIFDLEL